MAAEWNKVVARYPLLGKFDLSVYSSWSSKDLALAADYIAMVDGVTNARVGDSPQLETFVAA